MGDEKEEFDPRSWTLETDNYFRPLSLSHVTNPGVRSRLDLDSIVK